MRRERRRDFWCVSADLVEEVANPPHEDARVPETSLAPQRFRARAVGLLDKPGDAPQARLDFAVRLDVSEAGIRSRRHDAHRSEERRVGKEWRSRWWWSLCAKK